MAKDWGFVGPTYVVDSPIVSQRCVNLFTTKNEAPNSPSPYVMRHTPGTTATWALTDGPPSCLFAQDGRVFCLAGARFVELQAGGIVIDRGMVAASGTPGSMCTNGIGGHQVLITTGGMGYIFDLNTNVLTAIGVPGFPAQAGMCAFLDGHGVVLEPTVNRFHISLGGQGQDMANWSGLDVAQRSWSSDQIVALTQDHRELWIWGTKHTEVWGNTGAANFPFAPNPSGFIEQGALPFTICQFDNTLAWVAQDERGKLTVMRAEGYRPQRISDHGVEFALRKAAGSTATIEAYAYDEGGNEIYNLNIPSLEKTFAYNASTNWWHELDWYNPVSGLYERARPRCHCYAFGQHLVGDRSRNVVSVQSQDILTDQTAAIHRRRRVPALTNENKQMFYRRVEMVMQVGDGIPPPGVPKSVLRYSDNGSRTFGNDLEASLGEIGQYDLRVYWSQLGAGRKRVFEWETADAVPVAILDASLTATPGRH